MRLGRFLVWTLFFAAASLFAQAQYGSIGGRLQDSTGAVIPQAAVKIVNADTGQTTEVSTDLEGRYLAPQLLPGFYNVQVEHPGFKGLTLSRVKVDIDQNVTQDLVLQLGAVSEAVSVSAQTSLVETVSGSVGHLVENKQILDLP